ncbi:hypothetical protein FBU30_004442 [Linnemannia zychae]|nr:hypothetical protein FBU30_004442 [Linnemannia zychae]
MKFTTIALSVAVVASCAQVMGVPAFIKHVLGNTIVVTGCLIKAFAGTPFDATCQKAVALDIGILQDVNFKSVNFDLSTSPPTFMSDDVSVDLLNIPGLTYAIIDASESVIITDNSVDIATYSADASPTTVKGNNVVTKIAKCPLVIDPSKTDAFAAFLNSLITKPSYTYTVSGTLAAKLGSVVKAVTNVGGGLGGLGGLVNSIVDALPPVSVAGVGFQSSVTLTSFNGLPSNTFVSKVTAVKDASGFTLTWKFNIANPSIIFISLGDLVFDTVNGAGKTVGKSTIAGFSLILGDKNELTVVTKSADTTILDGLSTNGDTWTLQASADVSATPLIAKGLANLKLSVTIPALGA